MSACSACACCRSLIHRHLSHMIHKHKAPRPHHYSAGQVMACWCAGPRVSHLAHSRRFGLLPQDSGLRSEQLQVTSSKLYM